MSERPSCPTVRSAQKRTHAHALGAPAGGYKQPQSLRSQKSGGSTNCVDENVDESTSLYSKHVVLKIFEVTTYGSMLLAGRRSSK